MKETSLIRYQLTSLALLVFSASTGSTTASCKEVLRDWSGVSGWLSVDDEFGTVVIGPGDVDGDGVPDAAIPAPWEDPTYNVDLGAVYFISGATGAVLQQQLGAFDRSLFGFPLCIPADLDGDGSMTILSPRPMERSTRDQAWFTRIREQRARVGSL